MHISDFEATVAKLKPFLPEYLTEHGIDPNGKFTCLFPDHNDSDPSASVVGLNTNSPRIHCFGCGRTMDIFDVVQVLEKKPAIGLEWVEETLKYLATKYGVEVQTKDLTEEQVYELDTYRAYRAAASLIRAANLQDAKFQEFHTAIEERKWNAEVLNENGVGTVSSYAEFREALKQSGFTAKFLDEIDLGRKQLFNNENIIFTWRDDRGRPIGFTARHIKFEVEKQEAEQNGEKYKGAKYNNTYTTGLKCNIFQKGSRLYGIDGALKAQPPLYIFEGQADVLTARHHGILNCAAIAGSNLSEEHVLLLKDLGIYDVVLCLDGDDTGREKLKKILEERFAGHRDMRVRVIEMPDNEDPDSFIRKEGSEAFLALAHWSAFEWRLNQYTEDSDQSMICQQMIPFIVNEPSAVAREELCKTLALRTGVTLRAIQQDLNTILDEKSRNRSLERQNIVERAVFELKKTPAEAEQILLVARHGLQELDRKHNVEVLSSEGFLCALDKQKETEESADSDDTGFELGEDLASLREWLRGEWSKDVFMAFGGKANTGKTALMCKMAYNIALYNEDVTVIYHSIDDTAEQIIPRYVAIAEGDLNLTINQVRQPNYWCQHIPGLNEWRNKGYQRVRELALQGRLVVKDINHGGSLPFVENLIQFHQDKYPSRRIVYFLDNFHKLMDFGNKDERVRFKHLSEAMKGIATRLHVPVISTVEYTKLPPGVKPTKANIAETVAMEYDTNFIAHLYSEVTDTPDNFTVCHRSSNWQGEEVILPRVEILVDKNKITECKGHLYFDFWPASSDFRSVSQETVVAEQRAWLDSKKSSGNDSSEGWGDK